MTEIKKYIKKINRSKNDNPFLNIKEFITTSPIVSLITSILLLLLGAFVAALINFISLDPNALAKYIISFLINIVILILGFIFFIDFWNFRKKYVFIEKQNINLAKKLVNLYDKSQRTLRLVDGINAIQLFEVERHTDDRHLLYKFNLMYSLKSKYFNLSKFRDSEIEVPINFLKWLQTPTKNDVPNYEPVINALTYAWLSTQYKQTQNIEYKGLADYMKENHEIDKKVSSIVYHIVFETKGVLYPEDISNPNLTGFNIMDYVQIVEYNGEKEYHENRVYYTVRLTIESTEGSVELVLLLILNNKLISNDDIEMLTFILESILREEEK